MKLGLLILGLGLVAGCRSIPPPDPNDPAEVGLVQPDVLMRNLKWASDAANARVETGEITRAQAKEIVSQYARDLTAHISMARVREGRAWEYAEVFRAARQWDKAREAFEIAIRHPQNENRRVNDNLRLAHVYANLNMLPEAIERARSVFDAEPKERAPLIPALILEIVPAGRGKGHDAELAKLLEEALPLWNDTVVDETSQSGRDFMIAKPFHIRRTLDLIRALSAKEPFPNPTIDGNGRTGRA